MDPLSMKNCSGSAERIVARKQVIVAPKNRLGSIGPAGGTVWDSTAVPAAYSANRFHGSVKTSPSSGYIDLYYAHRLDPRRRLKKTMGRLAQLVLKRREGALRRALKSVRVRSGALMQLASADCRAIGKYSLGKRGVEDAVVARAARIGGRICGLQSDGARFL